MPDVLAFLKDQVSGLTLGGLFVAVAWFLNELRKNAAERRAARAAEHEERRAERESFDVRHKAALDTVQAHESNVRAQQQRADTLEAEKAKLREELSEAIGQHSSLAAQHAEVRAELEKKSKSNSQLVNLASCLLIGATEALKRVNEFEALFDDHVKQLERRLRTELFDLLEIDEEEFDAYVKGEDEPHGDNPIVAFAWYDRHRNHYIARGALLQLREAMLLRQQHVGALSYNTYLPMVLFELLRNDRDFTEGQLQKEITQASSEHREQVLALLEGIDDADES